MFRRLYDWGSAVLKEVGGCLTIAGGPAEENNPHVNPPPSSWEKFANVEENDFNMNFSTTDFVWKYKGLSAMYYGPTPRESKLLTAVRQTKWGWTGKVVGTGEKVGFVEVA